MLDRLPAGTWLMIIIGVVMYVVAMALSLLIGYLILKTAVKNGTLAAMRQAHNEGLIR